MEIIGVVLSLAGLMYFAYRGINVLVLAPIMALVACLFHNDVPLLASYTQIFMPALGRYLLQYFPIFLLGSIFGKLMSDSGAASTIGQFIARKIGDKYYEWNSSERRLRRYGEYSNNSKFIRIEMNADVENGASDPTCVPMGYYGPPKFNNILSWNGKRSGSVATGGQAISASGADVSHAGASPRVSSGRPRQARSRRPSL